MKIAPVLQTARPQFLLLTPICVLLGLGTTFLNQSSIDFFLFSVVLVGATLAHISVNTLNEYYDFKSGLDLVTKKTPFSGGSGALPDNPEMAKIVFAFGFTSLAATITIGCYLMFLHGALILPIGITGVVLITTYTQWINRLPALCLIAPGLGFGFLVVIGTHVMLTGGYSALPWLVSLVPFFLVNNLLLLNQYPDIEADATVGRKTIPIAFGVVRSNYVYAVSMIAGYSVIIILVVQGAIPKLGLVAALPIVFSVYALSGAVNYSSRIGDYPRYLGANVASALLTPLLLGVSILVG